MKKQTKIIKYVFLSLFMGVFLVFSVSLCSDPKINVYADEQVAFYPQAGTNFRRAIVTSVSNGVEIFNWANDRFQELRQLYNFDDNVSGGFWSFNAVLVFANGFGQKNGELNPGTIMTLSFEYNYTTNNGTMTFSPDGSSMSTPIYLQVDYTSTSATVTQRSALPDIDLYLTTFYGYGKVSVNDYYCPINVMDMFELLSFNMTWASDYQAVNVSQSELDTAYQSGYNAGLANGSVQPSSELQIENSQLKKDISTLQTEVTQLNSDNSKLQSDLDSLNSSFSNQLASEKALSYSQGYQDGAATNGNTFMGLISSVIDVPIKTFINLFDIEVLGYNIKDFLISILSLCFVAAVVRFCVKNVG